MGILIFIAVSILVLIVLPDFLVCDLELTRGALRRIKGLFLEYSTYEVSKAEYMPSIYGGYYRVIINEDGVNIPIDCPESVAKKLCGIMALNGKGSKVSIKAKIDHKSLSLISLKGYMVKQQKG